LSHARSYPSLEAAKVAEEILEGRECYSLSRMVEGTILDKPRPASPEGGQCI
jgi:hypothetical protein